MARSAGARTRPATRRARGRQRFAVTCLLASTALAASAPATSATAPRRSPSCSLARNSVIDSTLGVSARYTSQVRNATVLTCYFGVGTNAKAVTVRFRGDENTAGFADDRTSFETAGMRTRTLAGYGSAAFTVVIGRGRYLTSTVIALQHSTNLLVSAFGPLAKVQALTKALLALL